MKINSALKPKLRGMGIRDSRCSHLGHCGTSFGHAKASIQPPSSRVVEVEKRKGRWPTKRSSFEQSVENAGNSVKEYSP